MCIHINKRCNTEVSYGPRIDGYGDLRSALSSLIRLVSWLKWFVSLLSDTRIGVGAIQPSVCRCAVEPN